MKPPDSNQFLAGNRHRFSDIDVADKSLNLGRQADETAVPGL